MTTLPATRFPVGADPAEAKVQFTMSCVAEMSGTDRVLRPRGEADISRGPTHGPRYVNLVRLGRSRLRLGVQDGHGQRGAVVIHRRLEQVAAVQVDPGRAEVDGADVERLGTVKEEPGRVGPLAVVVVKIELDGDALADPRGCRHYGSGP